MTGLALVLAGCTSTRTIHATWDDETVQALNLRREYLTWVDLEESRDSLFAHPFVLGALSPRRYVTGDSLLLGPGYVRSEVNSIAFKQPSSDWTPVLIGAGVFAAFGFYLGVQYDRAMTEGEWHFGENPQIYAVPAGVGAFAGALIALIARPTPAVSVYRFEEGNADASASASYMRIRVRW